MNRLSTMRQIVLAVLAAMVTAATLATLAMSQTLPPLPAHAPPAVTPLSLLRQPIADSTPNAAQLRRGQYLVAAGDCMSCHLREGGEPLAGGLAMSTPFGIIYTPNITSDATTGIGGWSADQFYRAMHEGIDDEGHNLYPAFPYPWFRRISREDDDAILAYLKTTPPVTYTPPANKLPFPLNIRFIVKGWNLLFLKSGDFKPDPAQSEQWNRGAYLVTGLGHCSACHSPRNLLGAESTRHAFEGGKLDTWVAPDLTGNARTGLGRWSLDDIAQYLGNGRNGHAGASGAMSEVVTYSMAFMSAPDRRAVAVYLKSLPASPSASPAPPDASAMRRGGAIYADVCTACHLQDGVGQPQLFPPLGNNAMVQQEDATGLESVLLAGGRIGISASHPSALAMPSFAWKLTDAEIADVATYVRNSWGNRARAVSAGEVGTLRKRLELNKPRGTFMSGDRTAGTP